MSPMSEVKSAMDSAVQWAQSCCTSHDTRSAKGYDAMSADAQRRQSHNDWRVAIHLQ